MNFFWELYSIIIFIKIISKKISECFTAAAVTSVMSDSVRPHRQQPTRLPCPWDSPGKNTGVGCHFLLQCMKMKSEIEVTQLCSSLSNPTTAAHQAPPSMGPSGQEYLSGMPLPSFHWHSKINCIITKQKIHFSLANKCIKYYLSAVVKEKCHSVFFVSALIPVSKIFLKIRVAENRFCSIYNSLSFLRFSKVSSFL